MRKLVKHFAPSKRGMSTERQNRLLKIQRWISRVSWFVLATVPGGVVVGPTVLIINSAVLSSYPLGRKALKTVLVAIVLNAVISTKTLPRP